MKVELHSPSSSVTDSSPSSALNEGLKDTDELIAFLPSSGHETVPPKRITVSSEIGDDDVDEEVDLTSLPCCRVCLESECDHGDQLISPCMCKGTQQFIHRSCLDHWRSVKALVAYDNAAIQEGFAFSHCTTCKARFHLRVELLKDFSWRKLKFRIFVARDVILVFLAVQAVIAMLGGLTYLMDTHGEFRNSFSDGWDKILSKHPIPFYYCIGVFLFFVLTGVIGLIVHCSSIGNHNPCVSGCHNCCYGWGILDCFPASVEACAILLVVMVIVFAVLGIAYGLLAATLAIQRTWQRHYHILTKRELTKEYVVEDLCGYYSPPNLDPMHEEHLRSLKLL